MTAVFHCARFTNLRRTEALDISQGMIRFSGYKHIENLQNSLSEMNCFIFMTDTAPECQ